MSDTTFQDNVASAANLIVAAWLNDQNNLTYRGIDPKYATTTGTADAQILTISAMSSSATLTASMMFTFKVGVGLTNTTATTLAVNGFTAKSITNFDGSALRAGQLTAGQIVTVVYDGTQYQLMNASSSGSFTNVTIGGTLTYGGVTLTAAVTGTGKMVLDTSPTIASPTLTAPVLGTPASGTLTNTTGFPTANLAGAGTGVLTALAVNVGTAGAFVVNGGALGSPSSVGTIPAFTLGGTVAGGGNQINNVVIGASTPLAGSFTTLTASGALSVTAAAGGSVISHSSGYGLQITAASAVNQLRLTRTGSATADFRNYVSGNSWFVADLSGAGGSISMTSDGIFNINASLTGNYLGYFVNSAASPFGVDIEYTGAAPNDTGHSFIYAGDTGGNRHRWAGNGGYYNYSANNVNLSDLDVKPMTQTFDGVKLWEFGKRMRDAWIQFKYDDQTHDDWNNGYGAQLVREAAGSDFPELVEESNWGTKENPKMRLGVYDSDLMHIMGAITTESQFRIDDHEARLAALEEKLNAVK